MKTSRNNSNSGEYGKTPRRTKPSQFVSNIHTWINVDLDNAQKAALRDLDVDVATIDHWLDLAIDDDLNLSIKHDIKNDCFVARLLPTDAESPYNGLAMASRGSTPYRALIRLLYNHGVVTNQDWGLWDEDERVDPDF